MSVVFSGISVANIVNLPLAAGLCAITQVDGGWPLVFWLPGVLGLVWSMVFFWLCSSTPADHPTISAEEKGFLIDHYNQDEQARPPTAPLKEMFLSKPVHALWMTHMCHAWGYYLVAVNLTLYGRDVLKLDVMSNGILSCVPYAGMLLTTFVAKGFDHYRQRISLSLTTLRKIFTSFGMMVPALCMLGLNLAEDSALSNLILLTLGMSGHQLGVTGGYYLSHADIAGPYAGTLFGITNTMAQIPGFANPLIIASFVQNVTISLTIILVIWIFTVYHMHFRVPKMNGF